MKKSNQVPRDTAQRLSSGSVKRLSLNQQLAIRGGKAPRPPGVKVLSKPK